MAMTDTMQIDMKTAMLFVALVGGSSFAGNLGGGAVSDKVGHDELQLMKRELILHINATVPPEKLKARVNAIENHLEATSDFERPYYDFR